MIRPVLEYGNVIYDNCSETDCKKIESVQIFAARVCTGALKRTSYSNLCRELKWQTLKTRRIFSKANLTYKILNGLTASYMQLHFLQKNALSVEKSRSNDVLVAHKCKLTSFSNSFFPAQTKFWNNLLPEIRNCKTFLNFKFKISKKFGNNFLQGDDHFAYSTFSNYYGKILTQIRLGLSPLNHHRFEYKLTDNPFCPTCLEHIGTVDHYFLSCITYLNIRDTLFKNLSNIISDWSKLNNIEKLTIIVNGYKLNTHHNVTQTNIAIFNVALCYIKQSKRFCLQSRQNL